MKTIFLILTLLILAALWILPAYMWWAALTIQPANQWYMLYFPVFVVTVLWGIFLDNNWDGLK